jgi:nicotinamide-nucleotide amidase
MRLETEIGGIFRERGLSISVAESCTGGLIGNLITNVPGSSLYFLGGVIVYSNSSKVDLLHVSPGTIEKYGAVSRQTVEEMAGGVKHLFDSSLGLAVTGIAGPDGGTREKPVGTVFIGLAVEKDIFSEGYRFRGSRKQIKEKTAEAALLWVKRYLYGDSFIPGL